MAYSYKAVHRTLMIVLPVISVVSGAAQFGGDFQNMALTMIMGVSLMMIALVELIDKAHTEKLERVALIESRIHSVEGKVEKLKEIEEVKRQLLSIQHHVENLFNYHGLLDQHKDQFNANEMRHTWPLIVRNVRKNIVSINYLCREAWREGRGDYLVSLLGTMVEIDEVSASRIFILDEEAEMDKWIDVFERHRDNNVGMKWILTADYLAVRDEYARHCRDTAESMGFNVVDKDSPGITIDWTYENRKATGARLLRGPETAKKFAGLYSSVWNSDRCKKWDGRALTLDA